MLQGVGGGPRDDGWGVDGAHGHAGVLEAWGQGVGSLGRFDNREGAVLWMEFEGVEMVLVVRVGVVSVGTVGFGEECVDWVTEVGEERGAHGIGAPELLVDYHAV